MALDFYSQYSYYKTRVPTILLTFSKLKQDTTIVLVQHYQFTNLLHFIDNDFNLGATKHDHREADAVN